MKSKNCYCFPKNLGNNLALVETTFIRDSISGDHILTTSHPPTVTIITQTNPIASCVGYNSVNLNIRYYLKFFC